MDIEITSLFQLVTVWLYVIQEPERRAAVRLLCLIVDAGEGNFLSKASQGSGSLFSEDLQILKGDY
jgi:hypothetical protein